MTDYSALAAQAERDHRAANERYAEAKTASELASFRQVVFTAAAAGVSKINLEPSDQGDHMSLTDVEPEELHDNALDNELWDGISDLSDYTSSDWGGQVGVEFEIAHRDDQIVRASIDVKVAADALVNDRPEPTLTWPVDDEEEQRFTDWQDAVKDRDTHLGFRAWLTNEAS